MRVWPQPLLPQRAHRPCGHERAMAVLGPLGREPEQVGGTVGRVPGMGTLKSCPASQEPRALGGSPLGSEGYLGRSPGAATWDDTEKSFLRMCEQRPGGVSSVGPSWVLLFWYLRVLWYLFPLSVSKYRFQATSCPVGSVCWMPGPSMCLGHLCSVRPQGLGARTPKDLVGAGGHGLEWVSVLRPVVICIHSPWTGSSGSHSLGKQKPTEKALQKWVSLVTRLERSQGRASCLWLAVSSQPSSCARMCVAHRGNIQIQPQGKSQLV